MRTSVWSILAVLSWPLLHAPSAASDAYAPYVPETQRSALLEALRTSLVEGAKPSWPTLDFVSAESSAGAEQPIRNQVSLSITARYDVYLMRQRQAVTEGEDPTHWSLLAILVDRQTMPRMAYFLEFAPEPLLASALPTPIAPRVPCYSCHASGPRALRPARMADGTAGTAAAKALLRTWNRRIRDYGPIAMYESTAASGLRVLGAAANEVLPLPFCRDCHESARGVRAELRRQHIDTSNYLTTHGTDADGFAMPIDPAVRASMPLDDTLSEAKKTCLENWFQARPVDPTCLKPSGRR